MAGNWNNYDGRSGNSGGKSQKRNDFPPKEKPEKFVKFELLREGKIPDELLKNKAEQISKTFSAFDQEKYGDKIYNGVSENQLRKLFDEVKGWDRKLLETDVEWNKIKPYIQMIKSKTAYATARAKEKAKKDAIAKECYDNLREFISCGLEQCDTVEKYHIFTSLFEAVYGFYWERKPKDKNN